MYSFKNDYSEGAHQNILKALSEKNFDQSESYGEDLYSNEAITLLKDKIRNQNVDIHFVSGGTQANLTVISSILKPFESIISADTGHIDVHEAGAIEATGHKINSVQTKDGKLSVNDIQEVLDFHIDEHMVKPKLVFISNATEIGTIYKKTELKELYKFCIENNLFLYLDGARIGTALASDENDMTLEDITEYTDIFYIGGTKNGALLGEAIIIKNNSCKDHFRFHLKQRGALLAKGRIFGIQFIELFKNDLFFDLAKHADQMAQKIAQAIKDSGYKFLSESSTNQIFPILPNHVIDVLLKKYEFYKWSKYNESETVIRLVTSWATDEKVVNEFILDINSQH